MPIKIQFHDDKYTVQVTPPHGNSSTWTSPHAMDMDDLINKLLALGCHQTDIGDALFEANPKWMEESKRRHDQSRM